MFLGKPKKLYHKALKERDLKVNISKSEEYEIHRNGDKIWKKCKFFRNQTRYQLKLKLKEEKD